MNHQLIVVPTFLVACVALAGSAIATPPGNATLPQPAAETPAAIVQGKDTWTLESNTLRAVVKFAGGSLDLTSLLNRRTQRDYLSGPGARSLFRHTVDGEELAATDGKWTLGAARIADIKAFGRHWGKSLSLDLLRPASRLTVSLVFEIYDGEAGLRYGSFIQNDDPGRGRVISSSDILTLNLPNSKHAVDYVPWQTRWASTRDGIEKAKRNCLLRYDEGDGLAILPENNWCTSLTPGASKGDPNNPFLFMNVMAGGDAGVRIFTNPTAVQLTLFPRERFEYFWVNLQPFTGDALDGRAAVAEHFRKSFKYHDPLPQMEFQEFCVEYFQNDDMARNQLLPALAETGMDRWQVTWTWNGHFSSDSVEPKPGFTRNLPALADYAHSLGIKMGYYFTMHSSPTVPHLVNTYGWGDGGDLADPAHVAYKRGRVENILIPKYRCSWQMIDLGTLWLDDKPTAYSHPADNVYRKFVNLRNYMSGMARQHPGFTMLTTCETENPGDGTTQGPDSAQTALPNVNRQCVSLMLIGENGQAGAYKRTDGAHGFPNIQANLRDAMNYIGLLPLEAAVQVHGEDSQDPQPGMFTTQAVYASLLGGCSTYYSDVRRWTPEQRRFLRRFNDWRKCPRISALLREVAHPLATGEDNQGPYAWIYTHPAKTSALLVCVGFGAVPADFSPRLRTLDDSKTYLVTEVGSFSDENDTPVYRGAFSGALLKTHGLPVDLDDEAEYATAFLLAEKTPENSRDLGPAIPVGKRPATTDKGVHDTATSGDWHGKYGSLAAWIAGTKIESANGFSLTTTAPGHDWGAAAADARVPALPVGATGPKHAACWTTADQFTLHVGAPPNRPYRLTVHLLDHDHNGRAMQVSVKSADGTLYDRQTATAGETATGVYLTWKVTGPARVKVRKTAGMNAVVSAVFASAP